MFRFILTLALLGITFSAFAHTPKPTNSHTLAITRSHNDVLSERWGSIKITEKMFGPLILDEAKLKLQSMKINGFDPETQWIFFRPMFLTYTEQTYAQTRDDIFSSLHNNQSYLKKSVDSLKNLYDIDDLNHYFLTNNTIASSNTENILILSAYEESNTEIRSTFNPKISDNCGNIESFTRPDTLTLPKGLVCLWTLNPTWNDSLVHGLFVVSGQGIQNTFPVPNQCTYYQSEYAPYPDTCGYSVWENSGQSNFFFTDYILTRVIDGFQFPSLDTDRIPQDVQPNDIITIYLKGDIQNMTSWEPEFSLSGVDHEFIRSNDSSATFRILSAGQAIAKLRHKSLLVLPDESYSFPVGTTSHVENLKEDIEYFSFLVSPNKDYVSIDMQFNRFFETIHIEFLDIQGRSHAVQISTGQSISLSFPVQNLSSGAYFLLISAENHFYTHTIMIE